MATPPDKTKFHSILAALVKTVKTIGMYPEGHPSLKNAAEKNYRSLVQELGETGRVEIKIKRKSLTVNETDMPMEDPIATDLIETCFWRRIGTIEIFPKVSFDEFLLFCKLLTLPREQFEVETFAEDYLARNEIKHIWINNIPFHAVKEKYEKRLGSYSIDQRMVNFFKQLEEEKITPEVLWNALSRLSTLEEPNEYYNLLKRVVPAVRKAPVEEKEFAEVTVEIAKLLASHFTSQAKHPLIRKFAGEGLRSMADEKILKVLARVLIHSKSDKNIPLINTFAAIGPLAIKPLVEELKTLTDMTAVTKLARVLSLMGEEASRHVKPLLQSEDLNHVRNALHVMSVLRDPLSVKEVAAFLNHDSAQIRSFAYRALLSISTPESIELMVSHLQKAPDEEVLQILDSLLRVAYRSNAERLERAVVELFKTRKNMDLKMKLMDFLATSSSSFALDTITAVILRKEGFSKSIPPEKLSTFVERIFKIPTGQKVKILYRLMTEGKNDIVRFASHKLGAFAEFYL